MLVIDVYGKIAKTKISDKLKLYISNVPSDWKEGIVEDMMQEIRQQKVDIEDNLRRYGDSFQSEYTVASLKRIIETNIKQCPDHGLETIEKCLDYLADNMLCLFFDYDDEDMPFFDWTTNCFEGRFCEEDYAEKVMYFSNFVNQGVQNGIHMNCIYTSNMNPLEHTRILRNLNFRIDSKFNNWKSKDDYIIELQKMGKRIDGILNSENDYYKLDYIINSIYQDNSYNKNHFLKVFSLLELLLVASNQKTNIDHLLIPYLEKNYGDDSTDVAMILRQIRNKIAHGDFKAVNDKAEKFAQKYMTNYTFDYSEYSRLNWIFLVTCCLLDDLLRAIIFNQLKGTK